MNRYAVTLPPTEFALDTYTRAQKRLVSVAAYAVRMSMDCSGGERGAKFLDS